METRRAFLVDAFTAEPMGGNPAGVVPDADDLAAGQMQAIASELGASETVFFRDSGEADAAVRYFTPETEVDLCGHATIAGHALRYECDEIEAGEHTLETEAGVLDIDVEADGRVWMTQARPEIRRVEFDYDRVADALGIDPAALRDVGADLPLARSTTGLPFVVVPVNFLEHLGDADPDMRAIEQLSREADTAGLYAFTFDTVERDSTLHGRMFAPKAGVPEDPVTGTASGAVGAYLREFGAFEGDEDASTGDGPVDDSAGMPEEMVFEQGHFVDRPGRVFVRAGPEVRVGGRATTTFEGSLVIPEAEDDDIIEV